MKSLFKEGDVVYYTNPISFDVEQVKLCLFYVEELGTFWIDEVGAYLGEHDLSFRLEEAKEKALACLDRFYREKFYYIQHANPMKDKPLDYSDGDHEW